VGQLTWTFRKEFVLCAMETVVCQTLHVMLLYVQPISSVFTLVMHLFTYGFELHRFTLNSWPEIEKCFPEEAVLLSFLTQLFQMFVASRSHVFRDSSQANYVS
jgi:hypothetical protein